MTTFLEKLNELEKIAKNATNGEWVTLWGNTIQVNGENIAVLNDGEYIENQNRENDAKHITKFQPNAALKLIEALKNSISVLLNFVDSASLRYENPCDHKQECDWICEHVKDASEVLQEIEEMFK